jgi:hypothetical protein
MTQKTHAELMRELINQFSTKRLTEGSFEDTIILPKVGTSISASWSSLTSLKGCPEVVDDLDIQHNELYSLEFGPKRVNNYFNCSKNPLTSFEHGPTYVGGTFKGECDLLQSYEGAPKFIKNNCYISAIQSHDFSNMHKYFPEIEGGHLLITVKKPDQIKNLLSIFFIKGLNHITIDKGQTILPGCDIINRYLEKGKSGLLSCKSELIKSGYENWAKL